MSIVTMVIGLVRQSFNNEQEVIENGVIKYGVVTKVEIDSVNYENGIYGNTVYYFLLKGDVDKSYSNSGFQRELINEGDTIPVKCYKNRTFTPLLIPYTFPWWAMLIMSFMFMLLAWVWKKFSSKWFAFFE